MSTAHFSDKELSCPHCGVNGMQEHTLIKLEIARMIYGKPMILESAYRCKIHNAAIGGAELSTHPEGTAVDPRRPAGGVALHRMVDAFIRAGFHRYGVGGTRLHFDDAPKRKPAMWMYS